MNLFICETAQIENDPARFLLKGQESVHAAKVLRLREGDIVMATDGKGKRFKGIAEHVSNNRIRAEIREVEHIPKPAPEIAIAIGNIKKRDRLEFAVEKAVELGVTELIVFRAEHSEKEKVRIDRLRSLAAEAMKQSLRVWLPEVIVKESLDEVFNHYNKEYEIVVADEQNSRSDIKPGHLTSAEKWLFIVGPEGGFSGSERTLIDRFNLKRLSLGKYRLRTETAVLAIAALFAS